MALRNRLATSNSPPRWSKTWVRRDQPFARSSSTKIGQGLTDQSSTAPPAVEDANLATQHDREAVAPGHVVDPACALAGRGIELGSHESQLRRRFFDVPDVEAARGPTDVEVLP